MVIESLVYSPGNIAMRRLRLLRDEQRSRKVGHEVGSFARNSGVARSLTEALIGDKVIYGSNHSADTRAYFYSRIGSRRSSSEKISWWYPAMSQRSKCLKAHSIIAKTIHYSKWMMTKNLSLIAASSILQEYWKYNCADVYSIDLFLIKYLLN